MVIRIGTSGWQYDHWRGRFYPPDVPKTRWLAHFARAFPTVEVNNTFYRLPSEDTVRRWRDDSPEGFRFAVKASRFITHIKRLRDPDEPLERLRSRTELLGGKLGPLLFQLPPSFSGDPERLRAFLGRLPVHMPGVRAAFEFRHRSWETDEVRGILDDAGAAFVLADAPGSRVRSVVCGGWSFIRFHQGTAEQPGYTRDKLRRWADRIAGLGVPEVFVYFNNDAEGAAVRDAAVLTGLLRERVRTPVAGPDPQAVSDPTS